MGSSSCSESVVGWSDNDMDNDMEDTYNSMYGCNFDDEYAVDCTNELDKINFKELSYDENMKLHRNYRKKIVNVP